MKSQMMILEVDTAACTIKDQEAMPSEDVLMSIQFTSNCVKRAGQKGDGVRCRAYLNMSASLGSDASSPWRWRNSLKNVAETVPAPPWLRAANNCVVASLF